MEKHFYIFRHGECPFNVSGHIQGQRFNGRLTSNGIRQAHNVGQCLLDKHIEVIISSPMRRALETSKIVQKYLNVPIFIDHRFIEINMGIIEGMHISLAEKKYAKTYSLWRNPLYQNKNIRFLGGESKNEVRQRIIEALTHYACETTYQNLAISGHGITISQTLMNLGIDITDIQNGSIVHISYSHPDWQYLGFIH